jgi:hypothetical protein
MATDSGAPISVVLRWEHYAGAPADCGLQADRNMALASSANLPKELIQSVGDEMKLPGRGQRVEWFQHHKAAPISRDVIRMDYGAKSTDCDL